MRRLGLIVRVDQFSGLAHQTQEAQRWLTPDAVLAMNMGPMARGPEYQPFLIREGTWASAVMFGQPTAVQILDAFLDQIDVLLSVETFYDSYLATRAEERGIEKVLYANPELLDPSQVDPTQRADRYLYAAEWADGPFPVPGEVLPWPTSPDLMAQPRARNPIPTFVHCAAPAMNDRNGTEIVLDALTQITEPCRIIIFAGEQERGGRENWRNERVSCEWREPVADYRDLYRQADCLLLPRRYGALSLPMLEAAAAGVPTITTDLAPQSGWFGQWPELLIPPGEPYLVPMKGNPAGVPVYTPSGRGLARAIDDACGRWWSWPQLQDEIEAWAKERSWPELLPLWRETLGL